MSELLSNEISARATVHAKYPLAANDSAPQRMFSDNTFELPTGIFAASLGCFVTFLATMVVGFGNPGLALPMAIFGVFLAGFYGLPVLFTRQAPKESKSALSWGQFKNRGIMTLTGRLSANEAVVQVLVLPVLIVLWGFACITIAALV